MARRTEPSVLVAALATTMVERHRDHIAEGYRLTGASRVWERKDGNSTGRFVYRKRDASLQAIAYTIHWTDRRPHSLGGGA